LTQTPRPVAAAPAPKPEPVKVKPEPIELPTAITVRDLAPKLRVTPIEIIKKLMANGVMANINQPIDYDTASLVAGEFGFEVREEKPLVEEVPVAVLTSIPKKREYTAEEAKHLIQRPPVVTVMGHVDHGKTSLLDAIRHEDVVAGEFGGITQHIGAYQIVHNGKRITFLDTPGHEAFTAMRARGAKATDLAVIVIAADDGVMPQTREAIDHARAAQVPILVAMNKIDKSNAQPERVKQQLADIGLAVYGGKDEVTVVPISAKQRIGIDELIENILFISELADLRADSSKPAMGVVIESRLDKQQGPMATFLVQEGTLRVGDVVLTGVVFGKARAMFNERGEIVNTATPGTPVVVTGLNAVPEAGDPFETVGAEPIARYRANERALAKKESAQKKGPVSLNDLFAKFQEGQIQELNLIVKADVAGSLEPIVSSLSKLGDAKLKARVIHQGIGAVTRSDVMLAVASQGIIIAFNVLAEGSAEALIEQEKVDLRQYNIIYKLIEDVDKALKGLLEPVYKDVLVGRAQVLQLFHVKKTVIAGSRVIQGQAVRTGTTRVMRGGQQLFEGHVSALRRFTDDVKEVEQGFECGISLEGFNDFHEGDVIEFYKKERVS
jgi:translation initiation factor IF-2